MVFSSIPFIFYFAPAFFLLLFCSRSKNLAILIGSALFYSWGELKWLPLLGLSIVFNFYAAALLSRLQGRSRDWFLYFAIIANLTPLIIFKYAEFVLSNLQEIIGKTSLSFEFGLPLGISFFTFQAISYIIDVYRGSQKREGTLRDYATYIFLFPHLIAGPIVRYADIHDELKHRSVGVEKVAVGLQYFIVGLCQKVLIANTLASPADYVFGLELGTVSMLEAWIGSVSYMLQIYFDFCGYSNMAIGLAFMMGFHFPRNFNYPYISRSIGEFWRRWHISLSFWFRDYVYIPMGGNRVSRAKLIRNVLIVFTLTGLWHGAAWTFIVWGFYHGAFVALERAGFGAVLNRLPSALQHGYALLVVLVGWVIFRAESMPQTLDILTAMAGFGAEASSPLGLWLNPEIILALILGPAFATPLLPLLLRWAGRIEVEGALAYPNQPDVRVIIRLIPVSVLALGFVVSVTALAASSLNPFLYFRF
ncbi:MBOAT family protein [Aureimonas fodinaquatilis]|uniref:Probable alginate O-acetylase AlgI n=1 Tax=Aureimonas fodinaquatilis TaxID=2565783 RepID=A0A5B0DUY0_9HYPH|nr:MBOAT family O-acyltransferase [Aureimonas fodinaquatilis]KAA0969009.1 MBOAT family protein [Aureimonas fodinaquatilis]